MQIGDKVKIPVDYANDVHGTVIKAYPQRNLLVVECEETGEELRGPYHKAERA